MSEIKQSINCTISEIYGASFLVQIDEFRAFSLSRIKGYVHFDSAVWATFRQRWGDDGLEIGDIHSLEIIDQDPVVPQQFGSKYTADDRIRAHAIAEPGRPFRIEDTMALSEFRKGRLYQELCRHHGIEHAMGTIHYDQSLDLIDFVVLWRADRGSPFSDKDRELKEVLTLHAVKAWRHRQLVSFDQTPAQLSDGSAYAPVIAQGRALLDARGVISAADVAFARVLSQAFPDWRGPDVPAVVQDFMKSGAAVGEIGGLMLKALSGDPFRLLVISTTDPSTPLSDAEIEVARLFIAGMSNSRIAARRGVSPSTVRNQIASIYTKLGIHSKVELANAMRELTS